MIPRPVRVLFGGLGVTAIVITLAAVAVWWSTVPSAALVPRGDLAGDASATLTGQAGESVPLSVGCNNVTLTWPNGTPTTTVAEAVTPAGILVAAWRFENAAGRFIGFSPEFPAVSDLQTVTRLDAVFLCVNAAGTLTRPSLVAPLPVATLPPALPPVAVVTAAPPPPAPPVTRACCRVCTTGKACGDSCINANLNCRAGVGCACNAWIPNLDPSSALLKMVYVPMDDVLLTLNMGICPTKDGETTDEGG